MLSVAARLVRWPGGLSRDGTVACMPLLQFKSKARPAIEAGVHHGEQTTLIGCMVAPSPEEGAFRRSAIVAGLCKSTTMALPVVNSD